MSDGPSPTAAPDPGDPLFRHLADSLPTGLILFDHRTAVVFANRRVAQVLGVAPEEVTLDQLLVPLGADDRQLLRLGLDRALGHGAAEEFEVDARIGGLDLRLAVSIVPVTGAGGPDQALVSINDVTRSARLRDELRTRATIDGLTGCHNRSAALTALDLALADASASIGVLFIDLDRFKPVNDRLGHAAGDELLVAVARRLRQVCRSSDVVGRLGGDEFLVVCRDLRRAATEAMAIADRVHLALTHPFALTDHTVGIGASIGVAVSSPGMTGEELLARADRAMYRAKAEGDGPVLDADRDLQPR